MNDPAAAIALGRRIDLTREPELAVGGVVIQPTACEVTAGGRSVRLQPRVMEVLVALARAGGQPVSRETLLSVCWGDVTVGEDALNRCIQRLRRLAATEANGAFSIETLPRLGYRLTVVGGMASPAPSRLGETIKAVKRSTARWRSDPAIRISPSKWLVHGHRRLQRRRTMLSSSKP